MHTARIPPVDPAPATITAVLAIHAGHIGTSSESVFEFPMCECKKIIALAYSCNRVFSDLRIRHRSLAAPSVCQPLMVPAIRYIYVPDRNRLPLVRPPAEGRPRRSHPCRAVLPSGTYLS